MMNSFITSLIVKANKVNHICGELRPAIEKAADEDWSEDDIERLNLAREHLQIAEALIRTAVTTTEINHLGGVTSAHING